MIELIKEMNVYLDFLVGVLAIGALAFVCCLAWCVREDGKESDSVEDRIEEHRKQNQDIRDSIVQMKEDMAALLLVMSRWRDDWERSQRDFPKSKSD